jgi:MtrB/PioB family decaheme-associated outer membrane protein
MRGATLVLLTLALVPPAWAQDPAPSPSAPAESAVAPAQAPAEPAPAPAPATDVIGSWNVRRLDFGLVGVETDTRSSKFREYREVPTGPVLPSLRFAGDAPFPYDVSAARVLEDDGQYYARAQPGDFDLVGSYQRIPHRFGNDSRSLLEDVGRGTLAMSDTLQQTFQGRNEAQFALRPQGVNFAFLNSMVSPSLEGEDFFDVKLLRERGQVQLGFKGTGPLDVKMTYFHEKRRGTRGSGTSFGFSNVVETPEPIDYRTQDVGLAAEWAASWGLVRGGLNFNQFTNSIPVQTFDNPFRAVSTTDPSAYQAPGSSSVNGASFARLALPPDNKAITGSLGVVWKFGGRSRLSADATLGQWTQDEAFIPFTTNSAITTPVAATDPAALPTASLDGTIDVFSFSSVLTTRPLDALSLTARVRRYDLENNTPRIRFEQGYVRFDAVWEDIPRISVPYGYTNDQLQATAAWAFGRATVEGGYRFERMDRTFRETEETTQNTIFGSLLLRPADWATFRATVERAGRDFDAYHGAEAEHASYLEPGPATNQPTLRRYDQSKKDTTRVLSQLQLNPGGSVTLALNYVRAKDEYDEVTHGLIDADNEAFGADVDYTPNDRWSVFGFYMRENISTFQRGRQSGSSPSVNPLDDWTAAIDDKVDSFGAGGRVVLVKDRVDLGVNGNYQKVDGNNDLDSPPGGTPDVAFDVPLYDDTKLWTVNAELGWRLLSGLRLAVGGFLEEYEIRDAFSLGLPNYAPGSFFLAGNDGDYRAHVLYARATYTW